MTEPIKMTPYVATSNYIEQTGSVEDFSVVGAKITAGNFNLACGFGADISVANSKTEVHPAFEAKATYNFKNGFRTALRGRAYGDNTRQYRVTVGKNFKLDDKNIIYTDVHATAKRVDKNWGKTAGVWLGYSHNFNKHLNIWSEVQKNVQPGKWDMDKNWLFNVGATYNF